MFLKIILVIVAIKIFNIVDTKDYGKCYEKLETIQFRWTIQKYNARKEAYNEGIVSPIFPTEPTSETKWNLLLYPKGLQGSNNGSIGLYICVVTYFREAELATYSLNILGVDFDSSVKYSPTELMGPKYFPSLEYGLTCWGFGNFLYQSDIAKFVSASGALEFLAIIERFRKLPECLESKEEDLGRGKVRIVNSPIYRAYHGTTSTEVIREIRYNWIGQLPVDPQNGFEVTSSIFPSNDDTFQWRMAISSPKNSKKFGIFLNLVSKSPVNASFVVNFKRGHSVYQANFGVHVFTEASSSCGQNEFGTLNFLKSNYFTSDNRWDASVHIFIVNFEETSEPVCPLLGLKPLFSDTVVPGGPITTEPVEKILPSEPTNKELQETIRQLHFSIRELRVMKGSECAKMRDEKFEEQEKVIKMTEEKVEKLEKVIQELKEKNARLENYVGASKVAKSTANITKS